MKIYFIRHGQDDNRYRGGWSKCDLTEEGKEQSDKLAKFIKANNLKFNIKEIISSDLPRTISTATKCANSLGLEIHKEPMLREMNNGDLSGMLNEEASVKYPGLYFNTLQMNEHYPHGESPQEFYERIKNWFEKFVEIHKNEEKNCMVVTHSGVINIIYHLVNGIEWTNKNKAFKAECCSVHTLNLSNMLFETQNDTSFLKNNS